MIGSIGCALQRMSRFDWVLRLGTVLAVSTMAALAPVAATAQTATAGTTPLTFSNAAVGVASTSAQKLTETFTLTGFNTVLAPTATMNYGLSYKIGAIACTGTAGNQTCTVDVTFQPTYPGGRRDAIFLMNGDTRLATVLVYGLGTAPFALLQPGVVTTPTINQGNYLYGSVSDENGTLYIVEQQAGQILQVTAAGVASVVPITGLNSPREVGIDGAGVLYVSDQKANSAITTFDLVQGIQGTFPWPVPNDLYIQTVAVGNTGTVYEGDYSNLYIFAPGSTTATVVPIDPGITQPSYINVDSGEDLFIAGYTLNELPFGGTQTEVQTLGVGSSGFGIDAAGTIYATAFPGVAEYPASNYNVSQAGLDPGGDDLAVSVQANGTVDAGNYNVLDVVDRSQSVVAFGTQSANVSATGQMVQIYNGGNETLTVSSVSLSGAPEFTMGTATSTTCKAGKTVAPGAFCQVVVEFLSTHPGGFTGSLLFTTNSLNNTASTSTVPLSANIGGSYMVPSPTSLDFGSVADGSTSVTKTITLTNEGYGAAAQVYSPGSTDPAFTVTLGTCNNVNTAVGDSCQLNVTFSPTAVQSYSATGSAGVTNAGPGGAPPVSFGLAGNGTASAPVASFSPTTIGFPNTTVGSKSAIMSSTLSNTGNAVLNISAIAIGGTNANEFAVEVGSSTCGSTLAVGASCKVAASFSPTAATSYSASFSVEDDAAGGSQTVTLTGTGIGSVTASPTSINFGDETENTYSFNPVKVTIVNNSNSPVTLGTFTFSKYFGLYQDDCGGVAPANSSSCYYLVDFYPTTVGPQTGTLTIPYTGAGGGTLTVSLQGNGTAGTPLLSVNPPYAHFPTAQVMTAATPIVLQIDNTGTAATTAISTTVTGANASDFTETNNCTTLPEGSSGFGGSCNVTVTFTPSAPGLRNATITVSANGADGGSSTASAPLTGAGVAQLTQIQFSPTQLNLFAGAGGPCAAVTAGGLATAATLCNITGTAQDYLGNTYLVDNTYNVVYKVDTTGNLSVFAGTPSKTGGYAGDAGPATSATLSGPTAVATDAFGDIFISDTANQAIRIVDPTGTIDTFVDGQCDSEGSGAPKHLSAVARGLKGHRHSLDLCGMLKPEGLAVDSSGNLIWADPLNDEVFETNITTGGFTVVAGVGSGNAGVAGYNGDNILANTAELNAPQDVAVDSAGNVYIADTLNYRIRKVNVATSIITTVAGNGTQGDTGDGATATSAEINPYGVSSNLAGDLFIATGTGGIVRKVDTSGNINVFAGGGTGALGGVASTGAVANAYFARADNNGSLLVPTGLQVLLAGPDGLLQFGAESVGSTSAALTATVENTGDANLSILSTGMTIMGADAADFAVTGNNCGFNEGPGKTCALNVTFTPSATGTRTASLSVPTNVVGSPQIVLLQGSGSAAAAPAAMLSPGSLSFANTVVGSSAATQTLTLSNTGDAVLNISGITIAGANPADFSENTTCGTTLAAGSMCMISVVFTPVSAASFTASISVADDAAGSPQTATLAGTGTPAPAPLASLSPNSLSFAGTPVGATTAPQVLTLANTGNAVLNITAITIGGTDPADFADTTTCGATLAAAATCTISVTFTPASVASFTAMISVADNAVGTPQKATLTGTGLTPPATDFTLTVTPPTQTVGAGGSTGYTVNTAGIGGDFDSAIALSVTGLPSGASASFSPSSVTPGADGASSVVTVQTISPLAMAQPRPLHRMPRTPWLAALLAIPLLGLRRRFRKLRAVSVVLVLLATLTPAMLLAGCGGGYFAEQTQTYTLTVTGTSGSIHHSTTVTLTVQQ